MQSSASDGLGKHGFGFMGAQIALIAACFGRRLAT